MLPGVIALIVASLVFLLSLTRFSGDEGVDEQRPVSLAMSSLMRVAYYAWGAYHKEWPSTDAIFLIYFALCFDIFTCVIFALCSKKRAMMVAMLNFAAATLGCFALLETDVAACIAIALSFVILMSSMRDDSDENHATLRGILLMFLFVGRIATSTRNPFIIGIIIDCGSMFVACYSLLLDMFSEND